MEKEATEKMVFHLKQIEKLSERQIAERCGITRKRTRRILSGTSTESCARVFILEPYRGLIGEWYAQYPNLKAIQIYERLRDYGYKGSYATVSRFTQSFRNKKSKAYHALDFLPGEEAQIDWFFFRHEAIGQVHGFLYLLAFSRYAWGLFYPKQSFEFFLAGHLACFHHLKGLARKHRYDNLKSVVLRRTPTLLYNPQFSDFARFYGFSIHLCNPYKGNEKGRVERLIRDIRSSLYGQHFESLSELNRKFQAWLDKRNDTLHRTTEKSPRELLAAERLRALPHTPYPASRILPVRITKTALVEFETNHYSVPSTYASQAAELVAYPNRIEIRVKGNTIARHGRSFGRRETIRNPLHAEKLLNQSPRFKFERIRQLITTMDPAFRDFLARQENETDQINVAYQLFQLLKSHSRSILISAVRETNRIGSHKMKTIFSLLSLPAEKQPDAVHPQNTQLLQLQYQPRRLQDYDPAS